MSNDFCMDIDRDCAHIANMREQLRMSDAALTEATESIVQMRDQIATITKQRDLAVEAATKARNAAQQCASVCSKHLDVYPALMNMIDVVDCALSAIKESEV